MASRPGGGPGSGANQETEAADDFIFTNPALITGGSFFGLLPASFNPSDINQVRVEIYRVFPLDSTSPPSGKVPTRANSPSDVEFADRDTASGNLGISATALGAFTAANSVDLGIAPGTGGEGPVSGNEVRIDFSFLVPLLLPADHYFLVPQVLLGDPNGHFLWLSAPRPIASNPFTPDLQAWIRNADLDPDWLRVGTDIIGAPNTFNGSFALVGTPVPEPSTVLVLVSFLVLFAFAIQRKRRTS